MRMSGRKLGKAEDGSQISPKMEAKDTVMKFEERKKFGVWNGRERLAEAQAEISFKVGREEEYKEWVKACMKAGMLISAPNQLVNLHKAGIKEVEEIKKLEGEVILLQLVERLGYEVSEDYIVDGSTKVKANFENFMRLVEAKVEEAIKQERERIIPSRYAPLADFIGTMIDKMEDVTPEYGDWFNADLMQVWRHFVEEYDEWNEHCQDHTEIIDMVNCLFMLWCLYKKPESWQALKNKP